MFTKNGAFLEVILDSFLDSAESGAPHENTVNSNENEARALGQATKQPPTTEEKTVRKRRRKSDTFVDASWSHFGKLLGSKMLAKTIQKHKQTRVEKETPGWLPAGRHQG